MVHSNIALAKFNTDDVAGALESAREAVRIYNKHGFEDSESQGAVDLLRELEGEVVKP